MLHGEVGTGKSMLIDLFQECLPHRKKRRWHFNTFMLDTISRLEQLRRSRLLNPGSTDVQDEYSLLLVARDLIDTSPILFLDEFQLPDRAASKILSNLMTSFFQLGGVLIATSNRMPEELAKAAGMDFTRPANSSGTSPWNLIKSRNNRKNDGAGQIGEFGAFLEVLKARCQIYQMEGQRDYRKLEREESTGNAQPSHKPSVEHATVSMAGSALDEAVTQEQNDTSKPPETLSEISCPKHYLIQPSSPEDMVHFAESFNSLVEKATQHAFPIPWESLNLTVYGRSLPVPAQYNGVAFYTFDELCGAVLGPADYITLASTYHTFILTDIPVMGFQQKDEARRFITLLDALYEARCRLVITAQAAPDDLLFPEPPTPASGLSTAAEEGLLNDAVHPETFSEIYQDLNSPFRPNISSYNTDNNLPADALEDDPPNRVRQPGSSFTDERRLHPGTPNFADIGGMTGEDERFAVKRAESRIWEMCSGRWWERATSSPSNAPEEATTTTTATDWWRPLPISLRHWERQNTAKPTLTPTSVPGSLPPNVKVLSDEEKEQDRQKELEDMFAHGASPFRTHPDAPPKISWTHAWGMMTWGKRAGAWGKGVEGLGEREKEKGDDGEGKKEQKEK